MRKKEEKPFTRHAPASAIAPASLTKAPTTEAGCMVWRPLAMKGICECGKRFWRHSQVVKDAAYARDGVFQVNWSATDQRW